jgi:hypothetical protein
MQWTRLKPMKLDRYLASAFVYKARMFGGGGGGGGGAFALGKKSKTLVQIFLYAFFYVSRVTNLTTPRSAPVFNGKNLAVIFF